MATTLLFVELLVIGLGAALWSALLLGSVVGLPQNVPSALIGNPAVIAALLAVSYVLGIIVDRAAYSIFRRIEDSVRRKVLGNDQNPSIEDRESSVLLVTSPLRDQIVYNRSRLRICRSWILNFALIGIFSGIWVVRQGQWTNAVVSIAGFVLSVLAAGAAWSLAKDHYRNIGHSYEFLERNKNREITR